MQTKINLLLILFLFLTIGCAEEKEETKSKVCIEEECFFVEIAKTSEERSRGLMFRESMDENKGMIFLFEKAGKYSFWMRNTYIPLDIIWINDNEIVYIAENAQPCISQFCDSINPGIIADTVLEINAGLSEMHDFNVGDNILYYFEQ